MLTTAAEVGRVAKTYGTCRKRMEMITADVNRNTETHRMEWMPQGDAGCSHNSDKKA